MPSPTKATDEPCDLPLLTIIALGVAPFSAACTFVTANRSLLPLSTARLLDEFVLVFVRWPTSTLPSAEAYRWLIALAEPSVIAEVRLTISPPTLASNA